MNAFVFDLEADGLLDTITRIHCLCYSDVNGDIHSLRDYRAMRDFLLSADVLIGHNVIRYDIPAIEKILNIKVKAQLVDTLALSWYLEPERVIHGLEEWGEEFHVPKPKIDDWQNLTPEEYVHRCSEDVKINTLLWKRFKKHLTVLYGDWDKAKELISYLSFKMDCAQEQERSKWKLDTAYALQSLRKLTDARLEKQARLVAAMPMKPLYAQRRRPSKPFKKDGTYSVTGAKWFALLEREGLSKDYDGEIKEKIGETEPNPGSSSQVKEWLYSLGWKPQTFKYKRDKETGDVVETPQVNLEHGGGLCHSVLKLIDINPDLANLDELSIISHRLGLLRGFIDNAVGGRISADIAGLTNTLRFKHKTVVNLPKVNAKYGEEIRGCLIAHDGYELCGSDMSSLEDRLKQHYIYPLDPDYVNEMNVPDYDPHLSLALSAKEVTELQVDDYKSGRDKKTISMIRGIFKNGNYACQYGAGPARLALTANISLAKAKQVWEAYWAKNWAIKEVAKLQKIKTVRGQMWLYNPISTLWYSLRYEKDIFSTLVQGSASYVFDKWVEEFRKVRPQLTAQFHDEVVLCIKKGHREQAIKMLDDAIHILNDKLKLNRELGIGTQFGNKYSEIH